MFSYRKSNFINVNGSIKENLYIRPNNRQGLFSVINELIKALVYANKNNYHLVIVDDDISFGSFLRYFNEYPLFFTVVSNIDMSDINQKNIYTKLGSASDNTSYEEMALYKDIIFRPKQEFLYNGFIYEPLINKKYISIHIRKGDKILSESQDIDNDIYASVINKYCILLNISNVYYATDDTDNLTEIITKLPHLNHFYNKIKSSGYSNELYKTRTLSEKDEDFKNMMIDLYTVINSEFFICTYTSNVSRFIALYRDRSKCLSLDIEWTCCYL